MFGFSKHEREEAQQAAAIEHGLDLFSPEFRIALATTAQVYGIDAYPSGDGLKEERFLTVLVASAFYMGGTLNAEQKTVRKALQNYFSVFDDGDDAYNIALNSGLVNRHKELAEKTCQVWYLIENHQDKGIGVDREKLMMSLSQIYLGV